MLDALVEALLTDESVDDVQIAKVLGPRPTQPIPVPSGVQAG